ncbi:MAG: zinc ribbon domain-containing protein [Promethearchaeia archaeon]
MDERHTSSTCPVCNVKVKPKDRSFKCFNCEYRNDRDVVGSINILKKYDQIHRPFGDDHIGVENHLVLSKVYIAH